MKTNFIHFLLVGFLALSVCGASADEEQDLVKLLTSDAAAPQKCNACQKLRLIGTTKSVPVVATLLTQPDTAHAARYALEGMPFPEAVAALRQAAGSTSGSIKAGLLDSLGWRQDGLAVPLLSKSLSDSDITVASAAAGALGRIGNKEAISALTAAAEKAPPAVQPSISDGLLRCADQSMARGENKDAAAIYRKLSASKLSENIRIAAWRGLVTADKPSRAELISQALTGQELAIHRAALKVLRELNDLATVEACLRQWQSLPADAQLAVLDTRISLGGDVLPTVRTGAQSPHVTVRVAAWQALGDSGDPGVIPELARAAAAADVSEREAARDSLNRLRGPGIHEALIRDISTAESKQKIELLRALGERGEANSTAILLENAGAGPEPVRGAALESLRKIADPNSARPLVGLAAKAKSEAESEPILNALYAVCQSSRDKEQLTATILNAMKPLPSAERRLVLPALSELATPAALEAALEATREQDPESTKQAVRVLSQWPNADPAERLLELASKTGDPTVQVLALRGCISTVTQDPDAARRLAVLQKVMAAAKRGDEKKQALGQIGQVPTQEALNVAMGYLSDPELSNEAGLAALTIAEKLRPSTPELTRDTADKVLAQCSTPEIVRRAWAIRGKPAGNGPFIQDWLVSGPFSKPGVTGALALFDIAFAPETSDGKAQWKPFPRAKIADLSGFFPDQMNCVAYLKTRVIVPQNCDGALLLGSDDGVKAWLNGAVVHSNNVDRGLVEDQDAAPIKLKQGENELLLKVTQGGGGWAACARIVGSDGRPIRGLKVQVDR